MTSPSAPAVRRDLLRWFSSSARELPWRTPVRDPWKVWVSEVMLQQTRVEAVIEPYARFVAAFPTLEALARADEADVLARWSGLGYYRRARLLHAGARFVAGGHGGHIPATREELGKVPGVGAYTAGAVLSIAFGLREPALDANVTRVVGRLVGVKDPRAGASRSAVEAFATALVDCARPGDVNEALMDLGSALCTAKVARCGQCPLARHCAARASGDAVAFAGPRPRKAPRAVALACAVVRDGDRVLFVRNADDAALLAGLWDLPTVEDGDAGSLRTAIRERAGLAVTLEGPVATVRHDIVGRKITAAVYRGELRRGAGKRLPDGARLLAERDHAGVGLPALPMKILGMLARA